MAAADSRGRVQAAEVVLPCDELKATLEFFTERLGFRLEAIFPADDPAVAVVHGHGLRLWLERGSHGSPGTLRLTCDDPAAIGGGAAVLVAPNGTRIELVSAAPPLPAPPLRPEFVLTHPGKTPWIEGRAGMLYRDLVPGRLGGAVGAAHIRIQEGGPVTDHVHWHEVRFQLIYCRAGWVRVVYEDQGEPFVLAPGDCVLQPPRIRHRVLASSPGCEVIEVSSPAGHETRIDHELALPTPAVRAEREFAGQRFVRHERAAARWSPWRLAGFEACDLGIAAATAGLVGACVARPGGPPPRATRGSAAATCFVFVLHGAAELACDGRPVERLGAGDAFVLPAGLRHALGDCTRELELLEVSLPS